MATFFELQEKNRRKTKWVVALFVAFFLWLGLGLDLALYYKSRAHPRPVPAKIYRETGPSTYQEAQLPPGAIRPYQKKSPPFRPVFTVLIGLLGAGLAWWELSSAAATVLKAVRATQVDGDTKGPGRIFHNVVEEMSIAAGMPMPSVWIIPDRDPNAMAVGLKPGDFHVAATEGLLLSLTREELQAVVAHEIAHIKNQDVRLMTTLTVLVGISALIAEFVARCRYHSSDQGGDDDSRIGSIIFVIWLLTVLLAPLATRIMALMVSKEREYLADASAAQFTRNPQALISALEKISGAAGATPSISQASAHLCIASPTAADLSDEESLFSTHPPMSQRIARLRLIGRGMALAPSGG
ncbi:M48 family metallopeptidase [Geomonas oryzisoli]|uniref:M48 family metallopeptidase n=1 Tax=Geomonas oryzisoli TaxID=2847992 RepID=A0ABX8J3J2_9BACT|nr:M48 family metallopeptidase [Geomonas oryzisoli]QWV92099.1 M48 family metallopeptidase [Geomonas oryzisoli]